VSAVGCEVRVINWQGRPDLMWWVDGKNSLSSLKECQLLYLLTQCLDKFLSILIAPILGGTSHRHPIDMLIYLEFPNGLQDSGDLQQIIFVVILLIFTIPLHRLCNWHWQLGVCQFRMDPALRDQGRFTEAPAPFPPLATVAVVLGTGFDWCFGSHFCARENSKKSGKILRIFANKNVENT